MRFREYFRESIGFNIGEVKAYSNLWWSLFKSAIDIFVNDSEWISVIFKTEAGFININGRDLQVCKDNLKKKYNIGYSGYEILRGGWGVELRPAYGVSVGEIESKGGESDNIWIDREGGCYLTSFYGHGMTANMLGKKESELEGLGWVKVSGGKAWFIRAITEDQKEVLREIRAVVSPSDYKDVYSDE